MFICRKDEKEYALKQIEGTGISMSACREIAVSGYQYVIYFVIDVGWWMVLIWNSFIDVFHLFQRCWLLQWYFIEDEKSCINFLITWKSPWNILLMIFRIYNLRNTELQDDLISVNYELT